MLEIKRAAAAGTMESSDVMILIEPNENHGIECVQRIKST